jgi:hypothetical protein
MFIVGISAGGASCNGDGYDKSQYCNLNYCKEIEGATLWFCNPPTGPRKDACYALKDDADTWCYHQGGANAYPPNCKTWYYGDDETGGWSESESDGGGFGEHSAWVPGSSIIYNPKRGRFEVSADLLENLKGDWTLLAGDSAYLREMSSGHYLGYYEIVNIARGDLADAMGLQSNDVLYALNGYDLGTLDGALDAYIDLQEETDFALQIIRGSTVVTFTYAVIDD